MISEDLVGLALAVPDDLEELAADLDRLFLGADLD
jgi:hypothetical protein